MSERPQARISIRVEPEIHDEIQRIADRRYEGRYAMAAREAFRLLIASERDPDASESQPAEPELALAS